MPPGLSRSRVRLLLTAAFGLSIATPLPAASAVPFTASRESLPVGGPPTAVIAADLNADGRPDIVTTNSLIGPGTVSVLVGLPGRAFMAHADYEVGLDPAAVASGDVNADEIPDLVVANSASGTVSVLRGKGDGTFDSATDVEVATLPLTLALADVTGEGTLDLIVAGLSPDRLRILEGRGDGTFTGGLDLAASGPVSRVGIADLNADGRPDLYAANRNSSTISAWLNLAGGWGPRQDRSVSRVPKGIDAGELNDDGGIDLVVSYGDLSVFSRLTGLGNGTFGPPSNYGTGAGSNYAIAIGDVDGNGDVDVVTASEKDVVSIVPGNGNGTFGNDVSYPAGDRCLSLAVVDLDLDGILDVTVTNAVCNTVSVMWGNGDGTYGSGFNSATRAQPSFLAIADVSGGSSLDVIVSNQFSNNMSVLPGTGSGILAGRIDYTTGSSPRSLASGDLNMDDRADVVVANYSTGQLSVFLGRSGGGLNSGVDVMLGAGLGWITIADLDVDGKPDLVVSQNEKLRLLKGSGDGRFTSFPDRTFAVTVRGTAVGHLDGDGIPDLAVCLAGLSRVSILHGQGGGTYGEPVDLPVYGSPRSVAIDDLNGDGRSDIAVAASSSLGPAVFLAEGEAFSESREFFTGRDPFSVAVARVTADSVPDLVVANYTSNTVTILEGLGDGSFTRLAEIGTGLDPVCVATGDLDSDGRPDIVVADQGSNTVTVLRNLSSTTPVYPLLSFSTRLVQGAALIRWEVTEEAERFFYRLYRSGDDTKLDRVLVSRFFLTGQRSYEVVDPAGHTDPASYWLEESTPAGRTTWYGPFPFHDPGLGGALILQPAVPNPTTAGTVVACTIDVPGRVIVEVHDALGRLVARPFERDLVAGTHFLQWDGRGDHGRPVPCGIYLLRIVWGGRESTARVLVSR